MTQSDENLRFWHIRSAHYDKLFWVRDKGYLDAIIDMADLSENHMVLDVGTGTGVVANAIKDHVEHVVAIDISHSMLEKGNWQGISVLKWDIGESLFTEGVFDRVIARMVFHHILDNLDRAILRCYDVLGKNGKIVVAEGVPPTDDQEVIDWFTNMFKLKEERRTFTIGELTHSLERNGFKNIEVGIHVMENFSVDNWLSNSGLDQPTQQAIYEMHVNADQRIKRCIQFENDQRGMLHSDQKRHSDWPKVVSCLWNRWTERCVLSTAISASGPYTLRAYRHRANRRWADVYSTTWPVEVSTE